MAGSKLVSTRCSRKRYQQGLLPQIRFPRMQTLTFRSLPSNYSSIWVHSNIDERSRQSTQIPTRNFARRASTHPSWAACEPIERCAGAAYERQHCRKSNAAFSVVVPGRVNEVIGTTMKMYVLTQLQCQR